MTVYLPVSGVRLHNIRRSSTCHCYFYLTVPKPPHSCRPPYIFRWKRSHCGKRAEQLASSPSRVARVSEMARQRSELSGPFQPSTHARRPLLLSSSRRIELHATVSNVSSSSPPRLRSTWWIYGISHALSFPCNNHLRRFDTHTRIHDERALRKTVYRLCFFGTSFFFQRFYSTVHLRVRFHVIFHKNVSIPKWKRACW